MRRLHERKHDACKRQLIRVMKVCGGWKWSLLPPNDVIISGGRSWPRIFDQRIKPFTEAEEDLIIKLHSLLGNRWALIAGRLPDRSENEVKIYWNLKLKAKLSKNCNMHTQKQKSAVSDAASGLKEDSSVSRGRGLNLDLSMSVSTSPIWDVKQKVEASSMDYSPNRDNGNTGNKTLLLFQ